MIRIAICDDKPEMVEILEKKVRTILIEYKETIEIISYTNSKNMSYDLEEGRYYDLILSDIEMPELDGMKLAQIVRTYLPNTMLIFITSHEKYVYDAFALNVFRYIPKQHIEERLAMALRDAIDFLNIQKEQYYTIELPQRYEKISLRHVIYITRDNKKNSVMKMQDTTEIRVRKSLAQVHTEIQLPEFMFVERGIIVNIIHIKAINKQGLIMDNNEVLYIGKTRLEQVKKELSSFWSKRI